MKPKYAMSQPKLHKKGYAHFKHPFTVTFVLPSTVKTTDRKHFSTLKCLNLNGKNSSKVFCCFKMFESECKKQIESILLL